MDFEHFKRLHEKLINDFVDHVCESCPNDCDISNSETHDLCDCGEFDKIRESIKRLEEGMEILKPKYESS